MTRRPEKLCAQVETVWDFICRAVGNKCRPEPWSSHGRTSTSIGAAGRPMIRDSCATEISVGDGMASTSSSRAWTRYLAAASRGHRGNPQTHMTYRISANVNPVDDNTSLGLSPVHSKRAGGMLLQELFELQRSTDHSLVSIIELHLESWPERSG